MDPIELLRSPVHWPLRVLPVVREVPGAPFEAGYLRAETSGVEPVIHFPSGGQFRFASFEDLIDAGWRPD